jgi:hypothetical protein
MDDNDVVMHVDGAGVIGMKQSPYYPQDITSEASGFNRLPTKGTFVKIQGVGRIVYQSYPTLEKQGSNLIVEVILRALVTFMKLRPERKAIRNVSIFLDNTSVNKCHILIAAMSSLVLLGMLILCFGILCACCNALILYVALFYIGICRKVKLSYFLVGHGHCDGDRDISVGGTAIANEALQTFEKFKKAIKGAFENSGQAYADVERYVSQCSCTCTLFDIVFIQLIFTAGSLE